MADENKSYFGLLNGIARHDYYGEDITDDFLRQELYADMAPDEFQKLTTRCRGLIKSMAMTNMDMNQAEVFITSQAKKKDASITEAHVKVFLKFWKNHRSKIHEALLENCSWNNRLKHMSWRIDVKSQTRTREQVMEPTAIVELQIEDKQSQEKDVNILQFEMNNEGLRKLLTSIQEIEEQLEKNAK